MENMPAGSENAQPGATGNRRAPPESQEWPSQYPGTGSDPASRRPTCQTGSRLWSAGIIWRVGADSAVNRGCQSRLSIAAVNRERLRRRAVPRPAVPRPPGPEPGRAGRTTGRPAPPRRARRGSWPAANATPAIREPPPPCRWAASMALRNSASTPRDLRVSNGSGRAGPQAAITCGNPAGCTAKPS